MKMFSGGVFPKNGLALQATIQGTKYWKDEELN